MEKQQPYLDVRQQWNEQFASSLAAKRNWQLLSFIQAVALIVLIAGLIITSSQSKVVPYVVEVDKIGRAIATGPAEASTLHNEKITKAHLYRFIELWRGVITDVEAMRKNLGEAYKVVLPDVKNNILDPYYKTNDAIELSAHLSRQVVPITFLKQSENTYLIEWRETDRDTSNQIIHESQWKALITIKIAAPDALEKQVKYDPFNPLGIYISGLSWSEIQ
jgi:type IV secretion system protein TrbF